MLVVCIDKDELEFSGTRNLFNIASVLAGMDADPARQVGNKLRNHETDGFRLIGKTPLAQIDRVDDYRLGFWTLVLDNGISNHGRREATQCADLYHPVRRENVDQSMKK